jgi:hypothetical protein
MFKNIGKSDKVIRILLAIVLIIIVEFGGVTGLLSLLFIGLSFVFLMTALVNFCPLYIPFGIKTCKKTRNGCV